MQERIVDDDGLIWEELVSISDPNVFAARRREQRAETHSCWRGLRVALRRGNDTLAFKGGLRRLNETAYIESIAVTVSHVVIEVIWPRSDQIQRDQ